MRKSVFNRRAAARRALVLFGAGALACPAVLRANTTYTWSGGDTNFGYLGEADNWAGNVAPPASGLTTSDLVFGAQNAHGATPFLNVSIGVNSLTFNASALAFTIQANPITIGAGGITDSASNAETFQNNVVLGASQTWNISNGPLSLSGDTLTNSSSSTLTKTGVGTLNLALAGTTSSIGGLSLQGGLTQLTSGTLSALSSGLGVDTGTLNISGGVLNVANPSFADIQIAGGAVNVTGSASQLNAPLSGGQINLGGSTAGTLTVASGGSVSANTYLLLGPDTSTIGTVTINSGATVSAPVTILGTGAGSTGTATVSGAGSALNASAFVGIGGDGSAGGTGTLVITSSGAVNTPLVDFESSTSSVNVSGGSLNTGAIASLNNGYGAITLTDPAGGYALNINGSSGTNTYSGKISGSGTLNKSGGSTQILSGTLSCGQVIVNGGTLQLSLANSTSNVIGSLSVAGGTVLMNSGSLSATSNQSSGLLVENGTFNLSGGATFNAANTGSRVNAVIDANGSVVVTGPASLLNVPNSGNYLGEIDVGSFTEAGNLTVANQGNVSSGNFLFIGGYSSGASGTLSINSAGSATAPVTAIGFAPATTGTATVSGSGSILTATSGLELGGEATFLHLYGGTGTLTISSGGTVDAGATIFYSNTSSINVSGGTLITGGLNSNASGNGAILLTDPTGGTALTLNGSSGTYTYSGPFAGTGTLVKTGGSTQTLSGGGTLGAISLQGGTTLISAGSLSVTSTTASPGFEIGNSSRLNISGGATVNAPASAVVNVQVDGNSSATVTGAGSLLSAGEDIDVGYSTPGTLTVSNGGSVSSGTFLEVGGPFGGSSAGTGTMTINAGGAVTAPATVLSWTAGATGILTVTGTGSTLNASAFVALGGDGSAGGTGTLVIASSGAVNTPLVDFESPTSSVNVSGGSLNTGALTSLNNGYGSMTLTDPASGYALNINGSSGTSTYSGSISGAGSLNMSGGSTQILSGTLACGGVLVNGGTLQLSLANSSSNTIDHLSVTGGTVLMNSGSLTATAATNLSNGLFVANGAFNITGGASVTVGSNSDTPAIISGNGSVVVTGAGSQLNFPNAGDIAAFLHVGYFGTGSSLTIANQGSVTCGTYLYVGGGYNGANGEVSISSGGSLTAPYTYIGPESATTGTVAVAGAGSVFTAASALGIGGGTGTLTITGGGTANAGETTFYSNTSSINVSGGTFTTTGLNSNASGNGLILLQDPSSGYALNLNGSSGNYTYSGTISGSGTFNKSGSSVQTLSGLLNTTGAVIVNGGTLNLALSGSNNATGALSLQGGTTQVSSGTLTATSSPSNGVSLNNAAILNVTGGGVVNGISPVNIDISVDGNSSIFVTGNRSQFNAPAADGQMNIGGLAPGSLQLSNGATASATFFLLGGNAGATGAVTINGAGSTLDAFGTIYLGSSAGAAGTISISNAGVINTGAISFGSNTSSISITTGGGTLNTGSLSSFNTGYGSITLTDPTGGTALNINGTSGNHTYSGTISGTGTLSKTGASTQILANGNSSIGALVMQAGALNVSGGSLALTTTSMNSFSVTGGLLTINNGAKVMATGAGNIDGPAGTGITVTGANSLLSLPGYFPIGDSAQGTLTISQGGSVSTQTLFADCPGAVAISSGGTLTTTFPGIAAGGASDVASVTIDGQGSAWNTINLSVGGYGGPGGTATVTLTNLAALTATGTTFLDSNTATINVSGGTMTTGALSSFNTGNGAIILTDPTGGTALTINDPTATDTNTYSGTTSGTGSLKKSGGSTQILAGTDTFTGQTIVTGGELVLSGTNRLGSMNISSGIVQVTGTENVLKLSGLTIGSTGTLDLTTDSADISGGSLSAITALAKLGYANGAWNGSGGITSSTATADTRHLTAVGVIQNNQGGTALYIASHQFEGITPGASDILAKYTYYGDTNLDGKIDATDYSRIDNGYLTHATGWFNGDFNYDGVINGSDYTLIDNAFNTQGAQLSAEVAVPAAQLTGLAGTSVPEPAALSLLVVGAIGLLGRRIGRRSWQRFA